MIGKTYGRPAIGDIVGYTSMPDHPEDKIMQARIEGTIVEIPIDAARTGHILENNPPGSKISVSFYNCEWHIEGTATSLGNASPRIGISIRELLKDREFSTIEHAHVPDVKPVCEPDIMPEEDIQAAQDYINEIQVEFKVEAEKLLKSINLSHLQLSTS